MLSPARALTVLLSSVAATGCLATLEEYPAPYAYVPPQSAEPVIAEEVPAPLQEVHSILDMPDRAQKNAAMLDWLRRGMDQMDARLQSLGIDPQAHAYENAYQRSRETGASPSEAHWEAQRDMRNMQIFRDGGIPPNF